MQKFEQIRDMIKSIRIITQKMKTVRAGMRDIQNVQLAAAEVNRVLYHSERLKLQKDYCLEGENGYSGYLNELETLIGMWEQTLQRRVGLGVDVEFWETYEYFRYVDTSMIYQDVVKHFMELPEGLRIEYLSLPYRYTFLHHKIDYIQNDFSLIAEYVEMMSEKVEDYKWLYEHLADYRSKEVLNGIISYWFTFDMGRLHGLYDSIFQDYYDLDILKCGKHDVMVDLGAYTGDSLLRYISVYGTYKRIYAYEITPSTFQALVQNVSEYPGVISINKGVGREFGKMFVNDEGLFAGNRLLEHGEREIEVVALDDDIKEAVSVIKMDIEGYEKEAIRGAASHIRNERPNMLVSAYHLPGDIFEIPLLIDSIRDDYRFYLRGYGKGLWPCDYVLYAV